METTHSGYSPCVEAYVLTLLSLYKYIGKYTCIETRQMTSGDDKLDKIIERNRMTVACRTPTVCSTY